MPVVRRTCGAWLRKRDEGLWLIGVLLDGLEGSMTELAESLSLDVLSNATTTQMTPIISSLDPHELGSAHANNQPIQKRGTVNAHTDAAYAREPCSGPEQRVAETSSF